MGSRVVIAGLTVARGVPTIRAALQRAALLVVLLANGAMAAPIGWLYVDDGLSAVRAFDVDQDGSLTPLPDSPFATGGTGAPGFYAASRAIAVLRPGGVRRLYVSARGSATVAAFAIGNSGALTALPGSPYTTGLVDLGSLAATPDGTCVFAASETGGGFARFSVGPDGSLAPTGATVTALAIDGVAVSPDGAYLAAAAPDSDLLLVFTIGSGCTLTAVAGSPFAVGSSIAHIEFDAGGARIFAGMASLVEARVGVFDLIAGVPMAIAGSPFAFASGVNSNVSLLRPTGDRLYVTNQHSGTVTILNVAASGALSLHPGSPVDTGGLFPCGADMTPDGSLLFTVNATSTNVAVLSVAPDGSLSPVPGSPVAVGGFLPQSLVFVPFDCSPTPATGCLGSANSFLSLKDHATDDGKDKMLWKWVRGDAVTQSQLADPSAGAGYVVCLYAGGSAELVGQAGLSEGPGWAALGDKGFKFKGSGPDGITNAILKGGTAGKAKALVKGKGSALPDPSLPLAYPVTVQLRKAGSPLCLESTFTSLDAVRNEPGHFKAKY